VRVRERGGGRGTSNWVMVVHEEEMLLVIVLEEKVVLAGTAVKVGVIGVRARSIIVFQLDRRRGSTNLMDSKEVSLEIVG